MGSCFTPDRLVVGFGFQPQKRGGAAQKPLSPVAPHPFA